MKHINIVSRKRPIVAQFTPFMEIIGIFQGLFALPGILSGSGTQAVNFFLSPLQGLAQIFATLAGSMSGLLNTLSNPLVVGKYGPG